MNKAILPPDFHSRKSNMLKKGIHRDHYPEYHCRWSHGYHAEIWWLMWRKDYELSRWINNDYSLQCDLWNDEREIYNKKINQIDFDLLYNR